MITINDLQQTPLMHNGRQSWAHAGFNLNQIYNIWLVCFSQDYLFSVKCSSFSSVDCNNLECGVLVIYSDVSHVLHSDNFTCYQHFSITTSGQGPAHLITSWGPNQRQYFTCSCIEEAWDDVFKENKSCFATFFSIGNFYNWFLNKNKFTSYMQDKLSF